MSRVHVEIGTRAAFHLNRPACRQTALAGMQMKVEASWTIVGEIVGGGHVEGETTPDGRPEVEFTVRALDGIEHTLRRSWVARCEVT